MLLLGQYITITKAFKQEEIIPVGGVSQPLIFIACDGAGPKGE